jgi:alpha-D-xyloside xylohydrolase
MREQGCLLGDGVTYDAFSEKARRLYWKQAYEGIFSKGTDAWWADCTEPFEQDWRGEVKPEPWQRMLINTGYAKKYLEAEQINGYSLMHSRGLYEGQRGSTDRKRVVNLTRSAYAGQQRYGTITWSGDIAASWETLRRQIPEGLNFCASGLPYWTLDIGAFFVGARDYWFWAGRYPEGCEDKGYRELYVRWFQYGAFLPMFRSHGTETPREVWRFGEPGSASYDTLVKFIFLRYRLLPYLYSLAGRVTQDHYTPMRALAFDFRDDRRAHDVRDQYMFGPAFLVSPVTRPMYFEAGSRPLEGVSKARPVYLPAGCDWYDFWTGQRLAGGRRVSAEAPLEIMPIHVRAGSVVPMGPRVQHAEQDLEAPIELRVYPGAPGEFVYYEDGNDGYGYEQGLFATTAIRWDEREQRLTLGARRGGFPGMTARRTFNVVRVREGRGAGLEESGPEATVVYEGGEETVRV